MLRILVKIFFLYSLLDFWENKPLHFDLGIPVFDTEFKILHLTLSNRVVFLLG